MKSFKLVKVLSDESHFNLGIFDCDGKLMYNHAFTGDDLKRLVETIRCEVPFEPDEIRKIKMDLIDLNRRVFAMESKFLADKM